ncbi:CDP-glycerol glycerophosphotransferase family protein, partial [Vibrio alfacsensis]|uniref:CDP-glycerol glycerophosphotransferase family protein n=1 Tax=Vibrio alfacsensis TaxID=1074311 RepID=UPI0040688CBC
LMTREPGYWNYLLAQNPFAAKALPGAFDYAGEVLDVGYPRNDSLVVSPPEVRDEVRRRLGLAPDTLAILYDPTWRDSVSTVKG